MPKKKAKVSFIEPMFLLRTEKLPEGPEWLIELKLDKWLAGPEQFVPDSDMAFQLVKADERVEIIAYLKRRTEPDQGPLQMLTNTEIRTVS